MKGKPYTIEEITNSPLVAFDVETTGLSRRDEIVSAAVTWLGKSGEINSVAFFLDRCAQEDIEKDEERFKEILAETLFNVSTEKSKNFYKGIALFHNLLFDLKLLMVRYRDLLNPESLEKAKEMPYTRYRFLSTDICKVADTASMSRLLKSTKFLSHIDPSKFKCHSLKFLAKEHFSKEYTDDSLGGKKVTSFDDATLGLNIRVISRDKLLRDKLLNYNIEDTELTLRLFSALKKKMSKREWRYFEKYEMPHSLNLYHLAWYGVPYDSNKAEELVNQLFQAREELEHEIHKATGSVFNIDSLPQLGKHLFYNHRITYKHPGGKYPEPISPFGGSDTGSIKVDADTLKSLQTRIKLWDENSNFIPLVDKIIRYLELTKNISKIENLEKYVTLDEGEHMIFPNISASTKSGRVSYSGPNTIGLPKTIFKKSSIPSVELDEDEERDPDKLQELWASLKDESIRKLIKAPPGFKMARIDISGLDLVVVAQGAKKFSKTKDGFHWLKFLKKYKINGKDKVADNHFSILQELAIKENESDEKDIFSRDFEPFSKYLKDDLHKYLAMKPSKQEDDKGNLVEGIEFIHVETETSQFVPYPDDGGATKEKLKTLRNFSKKLNLATSYLMGAIGLATDLTEVMDGKVFTYTKAQGVLDKFYEVFSEIRDFQDEVSNEIYKKGYMESPFGRRFYAQTWDDLNEFQWNNPNGEYELILLIEGEYWYLKSRNWIKNDVDDSPLIKNMKIVEKPFGLKFEEVIEFEKLEPDTFRSKEKKKKKSKFNKKSETNLEEQTKYELSRIEITSEIDRETKIFGKKEAKFNLGMDEEKARLLAKRIDSVDGRPLFGEKEIIFYRVRSENPASRYFKEYNKLLRSAKVFFPMYCQGVANTVAITVLTHVRERFEKELPTARMLFFIHDEVVALVPDDGESLEKAREILIDAVENEEIKKPFDLPFTGEFEWRDTFAD